MGDVNKPTILVIEDENGIRMYLKMMFEKKNFNVIEAVTGTEGHEKILSEHPDIVVLDIAMVGLNGVEIYRRLREHEETKNTPIIFCSALALPADIKVSHELHSDYLNKPFEFPELYQKVVDLLGLD
jgi:DNA-binding response OmpR family regulator